MSQNTHFFGRKSSWRRCVQTRGLFINASVGCHGATTKANSNTFPKQQQPPRNSRAGSDKMELWSYLVLLNLHSPPGGWWIEWQQRRWRIPPPPLPPARELGGGRTSQPRNVRGARRRGQGGEHKTEVSYRHLTLFQYWAFLYIKVWKRKKRRKIEEKKTE